MKLHNVYRALGDYAKARMMKSRAIIKLLESGPQ